MTIAYCKLTDEAAWTALYRAHLAEQRDAAAAALQVAVAAITAARAARDALV